MSSRNINFRAIINLRKARNIRRAYLYPETLLSQYDNSPRINLLLEGFETQADPFDPRTAFGWGIDAWGRIVVIERTVVIHGNPNAFGFNESLLKPFNNGPFYSSRVNYRVTLDDDAYRLLVFLKAAINICIGTLGQLNSFFSILFGKRGKAMALHVGTMRLRLLFRFQLTLFERGLLLQDMLTPIPAGVDYDIYDIPEKTFGFHGSGLHPFNQAPFVKGAPQNAE